MNILHLSSAQQEGMGWRGWLRLGSRDFTPLVIAGDEHLRGFQGSPDKLRKEKPSEVYQTPETTPGSGVLQPQAAGGKEMAWESLIKCLPSYCLLSISLQSLSEAIPGAGQPLGLTLPALTLPSEGLKATMASSGVPG